MKTIRRVPIEISARHVHLTAKDVRVLFGEKASLTRSQAVSQPGQFAARERVTLIGPKGSIVRVAIVGPVRSQTQVEVSGTDARTLGVRPLLRVSGDLQRTTGGVTIRGRRGSVRLRTGVIIARRHLHIEPALAKKWGLRHRATIAVRIAGTRGMTLQEVAVRSRQGIDALALHLDTDEGNAAGVQSGMQGVIV